MTEQQFEIKTIENTIKFIFNKETIDDNDVIIGNKLINKWKKLTNWVECTEPALILPKTDSYEFSKLVTN